MRRPELSQFRSLSAVLLLATLAAPVTSQTSTYFYGPSGSTGFGSAMASGRLDDDRAWDFAIGDPTANNGVGRVFLRFGTASGQGMHITLNPPGSVSGVAEFGAALAIGDINGDGIGDLVVGAPGSAGGQGMAFVYFGQLIPYWSPSMTFAPFVGGSVSGIFDRLGTSVAIVPDVNADNTKDIAIGASGDSATIIGAKGYIDVHDGANSNWIGTLRTPNPVQGSYAMYDLGRRVRGGDFNGDNVGDIAVLIHESQTFITSGRRVVVYSAPIGLVTANSQAEISSRLVGTYDAGKGATYEVVRNLGGDGSSVTDDIVFGQPNYDLALNPRAGRVVGWSPDPAPNGTILFQDFGAAPYVRHGTLVAALPDANLDGWNEALGASAPLQWNPGPTRVRALLGGASAGALLFDDVPAHVMGGFGDVLVGLDYNADGTRDYAISSVSQNLVVLRTF